MEILLLLIVWFVICVVIAGAATNRGRSGFGWFLLAFFFSPLLAGILLLLLPDLVKDRLERRAFHQQTIAAQAFEPDGFYDGVPYRVHGDGSIEAVMNGSRLRFSTMEKFTGMMNGPSGKREPTF